MSARRVETVDSPGGAEGLFDAAGAWLREHRFFVDAVLAGVFVVLLAGRELVLPVTPYDDGRVLTGPLNAALTAALLVPLAWRRRAPRATFAAVVAAGLVALVLGAINLFGLVAVPITVHAVAVHASRRAGRLVLLVGLLAAVAAALRLRSLAAAQDITYEPSAVAALAGVLALVVVTAWTLGQLGRVRVGYTATLAERARLLEAERDQQAVIAAAVERARIAREMHDVVAHSLSVVVAQADGGRYAARADPAAAVTALETIAGTGRQALADMRGLLGVLREDEAARRTPQPGSGDLDDLIAQVRDSGLDVELCEEGQRRKVPANAGLAIFRIAQEALTNVLKHGGPGARAQVRVSWTPAAVEVEVIDDGRGAGAAPTPAGGQGLVGMRERAELVGGWVEAGPGPQGGWRVRAHVPESTSGRQGTAGGPGEPDDRAFAVPGRGHEQRDSRQVRG